MTGKQNDDTGTKRSEAPIDQMGREPKAGTEQNPPLPDGGPTDGEHGTDQDPELS